MATRRPALQPGDSLGEFVIESELGRGAMGVVYSAVQTGLSRRVALKLIGDDLADDADFRLRFEREAVALAALDSRHVVAVHTSGTIDGHLYIATQLVDGGDAGQALRERGPFAPDDALDIAEQVAAGLADAHRAGLVHRDVKPSNVLLHRVDDEWRAFLCDFGVARPQDSEQTATGVTIGTPWFMAPELHLGEAATPASDVYATGCLLWMLLTGSAPFTGPPYVVIRGHFETPPPQLGGPFGAAIDPVLRRSMAKDPAARHSSATHLRHDLAAARRALPTWPPPTRPPPSGPPASYAATTMARSGHPSTAPSPARPGPRRARWVIAGAVVATIAVATTVAVAVTGQDDPTPSPEVRTSAAPSTKGPTPSFPDTPTTQPTTEPTIEPSPAPTSPETTPPPRAAAFGPDCAQLPAAGPGSIRSATTEPVLTWSAQAPILTTTVAAYLAVESLAETVDSQPSLTVFAPIDDAWTDAPVESLLDPDTGTERLTDLLTGQMLPLGLRPSDVAGEQVTLAGTDLVVEGDRSGMTVSNGAVTANVVCGGIETANATVYLIDRVLTASTG